MNTIRVSGICLNQTPLDFSGNLENIRTGLDLGREEKAQLICFPELCLSGYGCEDAFAHPEVQEHSIDSLLSLIPETNGIIVCVGLPLVFEGNLYNVAALIANGELLGFTPKSKLPGSGIYYEPRWFKPWPEGKQAMVSVHGNKYPIGTQIYETGGIRIGIEICEDAWAADRPGIEYYKQGVDIILNPSASDFSLNKTHRRQQLVCDASRALETVYVYTNLLGNEAGRIIYDGEILIATSGDLVARNQRFSFSLVGIQCADVDIQKNRFQRIRNFHTPTNSSNTCSVIHQSSFQIEHSIRLESNPAAVPVAETREIEFCKSVSLGLFDYLWKTKSKGFVLSLSGGADSSTCAVLAASCIWYALDELGMEGLLNRLKYMPLNSEVPLEEQLLTCIYQSTENNSLDTLESAETLAKGLGAEFHIWDVNALTQAYTHLVESSISRSLNWDHDNLALQNIQARVRVPALWMMANVKNALLLTTSNRSESSVGYVTMDGDSSGGLAPLAGIDKVFIRHWLKWAEVHLEIPELKYVNNLTPSAELKPESENQTDEKDLMPYEILNYIESLFVGQGKSKVEIRELAQEKFPNSDVALFVHRYFTLFKRNQWKRERIAPSFQLDSYNLDPRSGFRFPILTGSGD